MLEIGTDYWYTQEDGGQVNIKVHAVYSMYQGNEHVVLIVGKGLQAPCMVDNIGLMVVKSSTLTSRPIDPQP